MIPQNRPVWTRHKYGPQRIKHPTRNLALFVRYHRGWTQERLCRELETVVGHLSKIENNSRPVTARMRMAMMTLLTKSERKDWEYQQWLKTDDARALTELVARATGKGR